MILSSAVAHDTCVKKKGYLKLAFTWFYVHHGLNLCRTVLNLSLDTEFAITL